MDTVLDPVDIQISDANFLAKGFNGLVVCYSDISRIDRIETESGLWTMELLSSSGTVLLKVEGTTEEIAREVTENWVKTRSRDKQHGFISFCEATRRFTSLLVGGS